jgi:hypothetical protein
MCLVCVWPNLVQNRQLHTIGAWHARCPSTPTMTFHCLLAVLSLCGMLRDRPVMALAGVEATAAAWDGIETHQGLNSGGVELDPLSRPFVHNNAAMVAAGAVEVTGFAIVANKMRHSENRALRDTWFLWQAVPIAAHIAGASAWMRELQNARGRGPALGRENSFR